MDNSASIDDGGNVRESIPYSRNPIILFGGRIRAIFGLFFCVVGTPYHGDTWHIGTGGTFHVVDWLSRRFGPSFTENLARKKSCPLGESLLSSSTLCLINQDTIYHHMKPSWPTTVFPNLSYANPGSLAYC
ncbi:hypothetical protein C4D60_Mb04t08870 [Musa balbisiana]|uniref:Uncharacterized protein n=1 Tax=Musa balbisiana TaxID=52838 RepID=A0A4S8KAL7_MUSBA|nr:hypothetical protein C4D60_Mb04t08870 [Musa balbisiana]